MHYALTAEDRTELRARGMLPETITAYIQQFQQGFPPIQLERACTLGDGIARIPAETDHLFQLHTEAAAAGRLIKLFLLRVRPVGCFNASSLFPAAGVALECGCGQESGRGRCRLSDVPALSRPT